MFSLLSVRVLKHGAINFIPFVTGENLTSFVSKGKSVVFFTTGLDNLKFVNYGITKYRHKVNFAWSTVGDARVLGLNGPAIAKFEDGQLDENAFKGRALGSFLRWLDMFTKGDSYEIKTHEELRQSLNKVANTFFAVDMEKIPEKFQNESIIRVKADLFKQFNLSVSKGMYLMRGCDRQLVNVDYANIEEAKKCTIDNLLTIELDEKPFIAGYFADNEDDSFNEDMLGIMKHLKAEYDEKVYFTSFIPKSHSKIFISKGKLSTAKLPIFVMFNTSDISERRWILDGYKEELLNYTYVSNFVRRVINGEEELGLISKPKFDLDNGGSLKELSASQFKKSVFETEDPVLVAFTAPWCYHCKKVKPVLNATAMILGNTNIKFYFFDCDGNDMPKRVPEVDGYPTIYLWPGNHTKPKQFEGTRNIPSFIEFLKNNAKTEFTVPEYNETEILNMYK